MKKILAAILFFLPMLILGQAMIKPSVTTSTIEPAADFSITGTVIDATTNLPIDYVAVTIISLDDTTFFSGGLTADGGKFKIDQLKPGNYELRITFLGYENYSKKIELDSKSKKLDLGTIKIGVDNKVLGTVEVAGNRQDMIIAIDKKTFDVEKNTITTGGTALDVLRQIPTLQVDYDGNISLRGSDNVTIFINGKNTGISGQNLAQVLKSMPASSIKNVELITNPSAKYDAAGMSGIINIITKKNIGQGNFGSITVSAGNNDKYGANGSWNYRKNKLSSSVNLGANYTKLKTKGRSNRDNFYADAPDFSIDNLRKGQTINEGANLSGNLDYTFNEKNSLSLNYLTGFGQGLMKDINQYNFLDSARISTRLYNRNSDNNFKSQNNDVGLTYTKNLSSTDKKNELVVSGNFSSFNFVDNQNFTQQELLLNGENASIASGKQHNNVNNISKIYTAQADYTLGLGEKGKMEVGIKTNTRKINDRFASDSLDNILGIRVNNSELSNQFFYDEFINAAYINYAGTISKWGYQGGLRAEQTQVEIFQSAINAQPIKRDYSNIFPSFFVNRKWEKDWETQASFSRRINRPSSGMLNPFLEQTDPLNTRSGNPNLNPEYVNAYEMSFSKYWTNHSLTFTNFYRKVNNAFQRLREIDNDGVSKVSFNNFGSSTNMGTEVILKNKVTSFWTNTTNLNVFRTVLEGKTAIRDYATDAINWNARINSTFRFWKNAEIQLSGFYMAPVKIPQGYYYGFSGADLGFKKEIMNGNGSLGINIQDIFNTRKFRVETEDFNYKGETQFKRESRWIMLNFTYKFGNASEAASVRKPRRGQPSGGGQEMNMGM